ncbi:hypothetical protein K440DRAFT_643857 [Wilcoxina mikolae CBS 423.85]|nr:hypothetical protein K440DRAFT_643857 [Wilcoxina mikolae CBS 423.85]
MSQAPPEDPIQGLAEALDITHIFATAEDPTGENEDDYNSHASYARNQKIHRAECLNRQLHRCPDLAERHPRECSHHPAFRDSKTVLPELLLLLVGGKKSWRCMNGIALGGGLHGLYDKGAFALLPVPPEEGEQVAGIMDLEFWWRVEVDTLNHTTTAPTLPVLLVQPIAGSDRHYRYGRLPYSRSIDHGNRFRLFTNNPNDYPLPHPLLFELQFALCGNLGGPIRSLTPRQEKGKQKEPDVLDDGNLSEDGSTRTPHRSSSSPSSEKHPQSPVTSIAVQDSPNASPYRITRVGEVSVCSTPSSSTSSSSGSTATLVNITDELLRDLRFLPG